jgi:hypothetical protein
MLTIDGVEYTEDQLSPEQKYLAALIRDVETQLEQLRFKADQLNASHSALSSTLVNSFNEEEDSQDDD